MSDFHLKSDPITGHLLHNSAGHLINSCATSTDYIQAKKCPESVGDDVDLWVPSSHVLPYFFTKDDICHFIRQSNNHSETPGTLLDDETAAGGCECQWIQALTCCDDRPAPAWFRLIDSLHIQLKNGTIMPIPYVFRATPASPEFPCAAPCFYVYPDNPKTTTYPGEPPPTYPVSTCNDRVRCTCTGFANVFECCSDTVVAYLNLNEALDFFDAYGTTGFQAPSSGTCFYFTIGGTCPPAAPLITLGSYTPVERCSNSVCPSCCDPPEVPVYCGDDPGEPTAVFMNFDKLLIEDDCPSGRTWIDAPPGTAEWAQDANRLGVECAWARYNILPDGLALNGKSLASASVVRSTYLTGKCDWELEISLYTSEPEHTAYAFHGYKLTGHTPYGTYSPWPVGGPFCLPSMEVL